MARAGFVRVLPAISGTSGVRTPRIIKKAERYARNAVATVKMAQLTVYARHIRQDAGRRRMAEVHMRVARISLQWGSNALSICEYALSKQAGDRLGRLPGWLLSQYKRVQSSARHNCHSQIPSGGLGASRCKAPAANICPHIRSQRLTVCNAVSGSNKRFAHAV